MWTLQILLEIFTITILPLPIPHLIISPTTNSLIPFLKEHYHLPFVSTAVSGATELPPAPPSNLVSLKGPSLYHGRTTTSRHLMEPTSVYITTSETLATCSLQTITDHTLVPFAVTPAMA